MRAWFRKKDSDAIQEEDESTYYFGGGSSSNNDAALESVHNHNHNLQWHDGYMPSSNMYTVPETADPYRPTQYPSPRPETLYISEQERSLYLAALSSLDQPVPQLTLYADPAPAIPAVEVNMTPLMTPQVPYPSTPTLTPKRPRPTTAKHAILTLVDDAGLRFTGFPAAAVAGADEAVKASWKFGIAGRSTDPDKLAALKEPIVYRIELKGKAWNRKGNQELESIRLLLAIFTALGKEGYKVGGSIASMGKNDTHTLLFRALPEDDAPAPLFFALSLPLPDRIAVVSPPQAATDDLIEAVRASISEVASEIKMEGWVHPGVYRFWIGGMRRLVGGVKNETMTRLLPPLMVNIMDSLAALHFEWVSSIPLEPSGPGRDILVFQSTPKSGLSAQDAYAHEIVMLDKVSEKTKEKDETFGAPQPSPMPTLASESIFNAFVPPQQKAGSRPQAFNPPLPRPLTQPPLPPTFNPLAPVTAQVQPAGVARTNTGSTDATRWSQPLPKAAGSPAVPPPPRRSLENDSNANGDYTVRPACHPGRGLPKEHSASTACGSLINQFPEPPRRPSDKWEDIVRNSTPGRYPTHLPTADNTPTPIANSHPSRNTYKDPGFPTNPTFPPMERSKKAATPPKTPPKAPSPAGPAPRARVVSAPAPVVRSSMDRHTPVVAPIGTAPVKVSGNGPAKGDKDEYPFANRNQRLPRSSVESHESVATVATMQSSYYSSTEDHQLVTPNLTSTTINLKAFPFDETPANLKPRIVPASEGVRAPGHRPLPPPPRKQHPADSENGTARPRTRIPDEPPQLTVPRTKPLTFEDLRNVRLSAAFDGHPRHSIAGSEFSVSTSTSTSSRPPGVGSSRARVSLSRASKRVEV